MTRYINLTILLVVAAASGACASFTMDTPGTFIELDQEYAEFEYRSATADGVVVAVRDLDNEERGTLDFWSQAIRNKMRDVRGYALTEESDVQGRGISGKQLRFGRDEAGHTYVYWVTIFVRAEGRNPRLWVIEAGGEQEPFTERQDAVEQLIATFEPR